MVDVRGDVLRPPHGTTPAAVKSRNLTTVALSMRAISLFEREYIIQTGAAVNKIYDFVSKVFLFSKWAVFMLLCHQRSIKLKIALLFTFSIPIVM